MPQANFRVRVITKMKLKVIKCKSSLQRIASSHKHSVISAEYGDNWPQNKHNLM